MWDFAAGARIPPKTARNPFISRTHLRLGPLASGLLGSGQNGVPKVLRKSTFPIKSKQIGFSQRVRRVATRSPRVKRIAADGKRARQHTRQNLHLRLEGAIAIV